MVYAAHMRAAFSTAARRNAVLSDIETRIATRPRWGDSTVVAADLSSPEENIPNGTNGLIFDARFESRLDAEDLIQRVRQFATGVRQPLPGSWIAIHNCSHDQTAEPCVVEEADRTVW